MQTSAIGNLSRFYFYDFHGKYLLMAVRSDLKSDVCPIEIKPLNNPIEKNTETVFKNLGVALATDVRFTFNNNNSDPNLARWTANISEIEWSGTQLPDAPVNKLEAQTLLETADAIDPLGLDEQTVTAINNAKAELKKLFEKEFPDRKLLEGAVCELKHMLTENAIAHMHR